MGAFNWDLALSRASSRAATMAWTRSAGFEGQDSKAKDRVGLGARSRERRACSIARVPLPQHGSRNGRLMSAWPMAKIAAANVSLSGELALCAR